MTAESPCVNVCVIDDDRGICAGCGRTLAEIAAWINLDREERSAINAQLAARLRPVSAT